MTIKNVSRLDQVSPGSRFAQGELLVCDYPTWRSGWQQSWPGALTQALQQLAM